MLSVASVPDGRGKLSDGTVRDRPWASSVLPWALRDWAVTTSTGARVSRRERREARCPVMTTWVVSDGVAAVVVVDCVVWARTAGAAESVTAIDSASAVVRYRRELDMECSFET